jgi:hypothetical protein
MWRIPTTAEETGYFKANLIDCECGCYSIAGDYGLGLVDCYLLRVKSIGVSALGDESGLASFSGCGAFALPIADSCVFIDCEMGPNSAGLNAKNEGLWIRCRGGANCMATGSIGIAGEFAGVDIDGIWGADSCGGTDGDTYPTAQAKLTGTLIRTQILGSTSPHHLEGAKLFGCTLTMASANVDCIKLNDSTSVVHDCTLTPKGTGYAINAASALTVDAVGNRYGALALHANVTNTGKPLDVATFGPPTNTQMEARTLASSAYATAATQGTQGSTLASILEDTGATLPEAIAGVSSTQTITIETQEITVGS